jgi:glutaminyl-tRNA synthetase
MAVLDPVKLIIDNYPDGQEDVLDAVNNPEDEAMGSRKILFSKELWIERDDFMENPPKNYFRLYPGGEVRLKYAYIIRCDYVTKNEDGIITEIHCTYFPETRSGMAESNRKVKGTIHWLSAIHARKAEVRLFDRLFSVPNPDEAAEGKTFIDNLNPDSLQVKEAFIEPKLLSEKPLSNYQFERLGYFSIDRDPTAEKLVFNRTVTLKDSWAKELIKK